MNIEQINQKPKVTIVTPSYNQGQFIEETIQSVLAQTYPNIEYIVVDGNSTDGTHAILEKYREQIDRLIIEPDKGQSDAINKGFRLATGQLVGWLNSDDVLLPGAVEAAVSTFQRHPGSSILYGDLVVIDEQGHELTTLMPPKHLTFAMLVNGKGMIVQPGSFYPADLVRQVGGLNENFYIIMDRDLWIRLLQLGDGHHTGRNMACFRHHQKAKSSEPPTTYLRETLLLNKQYPPHLLSRRTFQLIGLKVRCLFSGRQSLKIQEIYNVRES